MNYKNTRKTLDKLSDLNTKIDQKKRERENAKNYNRISPHRELNYDLKALAEEIQEMELLFNRTKREL